MSSISSTEKNIFIASSSVDKAHYQPVANILADRGFNPTVYEADRVASGLASLSIHLDEVNGLSIVYDSEVIQPGNIDAAWYRRPEAFDYHEQDKAKLLTLEYEADQSQAIIWNSIPESVWLNSPYKNRQIEEKIGQLVMAQNFGFKVPETFISNQWEEIKEQLPGEVIFKMRRGLLYEDDSAKALFTTILEPEKIDELMSSNVPFPGMFQSYISKAREWRVTVVGDRSFEAAIYTTEEAKDDWRKHQFGSDVRFAKEKFPDDIKERCIRFLGHVGLRFGAFDFVESHDGEITYLELNPNGQYMWLEKDLGFPISEAIADELTTIATGS